MSKLIFKYDKLIGKIVEKYKTRGKFAEAMDISERSLSLKLNGKVPFTQQEILKACELLEIDNSDIGIYFFTAIVQKIELGA